MNYQHAFHAGNFADVHKHAVLARILVHLRDKPAPFRVIDSHAGAGRYDLFGAQARRGGEWQSGIGAVWQTLTVHRGEGEPSPEESSERIRALLTPYLDAVAVCNSGGALRAYPGSPLIAQGLLRPDDRLIACETEPRTAAALKAALGRDRRAKVLAIDGWTALGAYVPPKERRGVVLVDPPFEDAADFDRLAGAVAAAHRKWPTGIYMLWYPITTRAAPDALARRLSKLAVPRLLRSELLIKPAQPDAGLTGSGLIVINPPFRLDAELRTLLAVLAQMLSPDARHHLDWLAGEP
jgi:23S rRNA (adenine2030-N6)-methyltransferase